MSLWKKLEWLEEEQEAAEVVLEHLADEYHAMGDYEDAIDALELLLQSRELRFDLSQERLRRSA
jgi:hypothetical protein